MIRMFSLTAATLICVATAPAAVAQTTTTTTTVQTPGAASSAQVSATVQAQYDRDMAAYRASLRAAHRDTRANDAHYRHQQRAYADAMAAWRAQVDACHHGHNRACEAPTPDPANYY